VKYTQEDSQCWWLADQFGKDPHDILYPYIQQQLGNQAGRYENMRRLIAAYERGSKFRWREETDDTVLTDKSLTFNHARNAVDTVHCKLFKGSITPSVLTVGGNALQRRRAKDLEEALHGELRKNKFDAIEEEMGVDALTCSIGWCHILHGMPTLTIDWVPSEDVLFDPAETRQKKPPRFIARRFVMDKWVALEKWGKSDPNFYGTPKSRRDAIRKAKLLKTYDVSRDVLGTLIEVWAGYHSASGDDAGDGAYAVVIDGATLEFHEWNRDYIPLYPLVPHPRRRSLYGISLMGDFLPVQEEHDKLSLRIQKAHHRIGGTHILTPREAEVDQRDLNNEQGTAIEFNGSAPGGGPREFNPTPVNPSTYEYRNSIISEMYASHGIPTMTATGQVPEGMAGASGKALQTQEEAVAERLMIPLRARNRLWQAVSWGIVEEARCMVEDDPSYSVLHKGERGALKKIKWKDVLLDRDEFVLDVPIINALSQNPSARFAQLTEMLKAGGIQVEQFRRLFGLPDIEAENDVDLADIEIIDKVMAEIVIEGKALQPEPFDYLKLIIQRGRKFYNMCRNKGVPDERLALLRDYLTRAKQMDDAETAKMAALQNPQGQAMPGGAVGPIAAPSMPGPNPGGGGGAPPPGAPPMAA
jgi:hypothetical protein